MKTLLRVTHNIPWMPLDSEGRLYHTDELPPLEHCTTAFVFAFEGELLLLTRLAKRGWDIPGGHIEPGETSVQAAVRETLEETGVLVEQLALIGVQELEVFGALPRAGWTQPQRAQIFYQGRVARLDPFFATDEALERGFFVPTDARVLPTMVNHDLLFEIALQSCRSD